MESAAIDVSPNEDGNVAVRVDSATFQSGTYDGIKTGLGESLAVNPASTTPDLAIISSVEYGVPSGEQSFRLEARLHNKGTAASGATTLRYYRSTDAILSTSDTELDTDAIAGLAPSENSVQSGNLMLPVEPATYYFGACVDAVPEESDTTNNCLAGGPKTVDAGSPDLVVVNPTVSGNRLPLRGSITLKASVHNQGDATSNSGLLRYYLSTDSTITTSDTTAGSHTLQRIAASADYHTSLKQTVPWRSGSYYYGACVDAVYGESDISNNCSTTVPITVVDTTTPLLTVSGITPIEYAENGTAPLATYAVADTDATITWSLSGDDNGHFSISTAGVLTFNTSPDYENAVDANGDKVYEVTVNATDGTTTGTLDVTATVTDQAEGQIGGL